MEEQDILDELAEEFGIEIDTYINDSKEILSDEFICNSF
jgi:hypothetical protein